MIMLLWLVSFINLRMRNASVFMSTFTHLMRNMANANVLAYSQAVKVILVYLIASVGANVYENDPSIGAFCDNSSMLIDVEFKDPFHGLIYTPGDALISSCSFPASPFLNDTKLKLALPFGNCAFEVSAVSEDRISISSTIIVQQHRMLKTEYDTSLNVTCELSLPMDTFRQWYYPNETVTAGKLHTGSVRIPEMSSRLETKVGSDLFPDDAESESELFLVVIINDGGKNRDMSVQNCIAHDDQVLSGETSLYQMSDVFGCANASYPLSNFTVSNSTDGTGDLIAYTKLESLSLIAVDELFITCGVVLCKNSCQNGCEANSSQTHYLDDIVVRKFADRNPGATIPTSLDNFDRRQPLLVSKRKGILSDFFSSWTAAPEPIEEFQEIVLNETMVEEFKNFTVMDIVSISNDLKVVTSTQDSVETFKSMFHNESTKLLNKYRESKVMDRFAITLMVLIVISCYGGLLYWTKV